MKNLFKNLTILILAFLVIAAIFSSFTSDQVKPDSISLSLLVEQIKQEQVAEININDLDIAIKLVDDTQQVSRRENNESLVQSLVNLGLTPEELAKVKITIESPSKLSFWLGAVLPFLAPLLIIGLFIFLMARQVQGFNQKAMSFGQSTNKEPQKKDSPKVTFKDVAGVKEGKQELEEVVSFLKNPKKFTDLGARIPTGVLLIGAPGTGKTLLAKAVSGEAGVPFIHISGSEFVEMFVGVGASRVRSLFQRAKKQAPAIIFVDEIDAVGRRRGTGLGGSHDEREQTLNQILVELDGFDTDTNVIVMAATNRPDVLDPALLRPGRFDRRVTIDLPDINDREAILKIHAKNKPLVEEVNLRRVAERTPGFSGADLANLLNEAAILTARRDKKKVGQAEILESIEKVMLGPERKSHVMNEEEKKITAYHEAGHALVAHHLPHTDPVHKVSVISRGSAGGYTIKLPEQDKHLHSRSEFIEDLSVLLAGQATEKEVFGEITTGASSDLRQATELAKRIVTSYGMSEKLAPRTYGEKEEMIFLGREIHEQKDYSEDTAKKIDLEVSSLITRAYTKARDIIKKHRSSMDKIVEKLLEQETLEKEEFEAIVGQKKKFKMAVTV
jgi:cell division protease FtsH